MIILADKYMNRMLKMFKKLDIWNEISGIIIKYRVKSTINNIFVLLFVRI